MPRRQPKKSMGRGAKVSCALKYLWPHDIVKTSFPNANLQRRVELMVIRKEEHRDSGGKPSIRVYVYSDEIRNEEHFIEFFTHPCHFRIIEEGPEEYFFDPPALQAAGGTLEENELPEEVINLLSLNRNLIDEDFDCVRGMVDFDDDNAPAPENIPDDSNEERDGPRYYDWGHSGVCYRRKEYHADNKPVLVDYRNDGDDLVALFEHFFPVKFLKDVVLKKINENIEGTSVLYGELLRWLGCWLAMATITGPQRNAFWSVAEPNFLKGAPFRLNKIISGNRFNSILAAIEYTDDNPPPYNDRFHHIRSLVDAWNKNMQEHFVCSWVACLDESMSVWNTQYTCPGFMVVPRKPHPLGNEWHTIACGLCGILFRLELVEGKDAPPEKPAPEFNDKGKTVGLLLRLTRPIWGAGRVLILDSGFCVLQALVELKKHGVFASAVIKKRRYWPKHINGEDIKEWFETKVIGEADAIPGLLDGVAFHVYGTKDANFTSLFMSTYGTLEKSGRKVKKFGKVNNQMQRFEYEYTEVFANHYKYRGIIDTHNALRHKPISIEETWATKSWPNRVFAFLLAVSEVNMFQAANYFYDKKYESILEFRQALADKLIYNTYYVKEQQDLVLNSPRRSRRSSTLDRHILLNLPKKRKFLKTTMVESTSDYPQFKCNSCKRKVRTYCRCSPGVIRCQDCFVKHYASILNDD
jgi:Transposase IS4